MDDYRDRLGRAHINSCQDNRHEELVSEEPDRAAELKTKRAEAREVIRSHKANYPEVVA